MFTCNCPRDENINFACSKALSWLDILNKGKINDIERMRSLYFPLISCEECSDYEDQIFKDINRTFPKCSQF